MIMAAVKLAQKYKKKIFMTGQTIGPLDEEDKVRLQPVFSKIDLIDLRDHSCEQYLKSCGCKVQVTMDDVLIHTMPGYHQPDQPELLPFIEKPHINLCFQEWKLSRENECRYRMVKQKMASFLENYCSRHKEVLINILEFMPLDADMKCGREIVEYLSDEIKNRCHFVCLANAEFLRGGVLQIIKTARFNIGTRYHMALFSLESGIPTLSIVLDEYYGLKLEQIHQLFDSDGYIELNTDAVGKIGKWLKKRSVNEERQTKNLDIRKKEKIDGINNLTGVCGVREKNLKGSICRWIDVIRSKMNTTKHG